MMCIYKTGKFAPAWTTILKIKAIFVHQILNMLFVIISVYKKKLHYLWSYQHLLNVEKHGMLFI